MPGALGIAERDCTAEDDTTVLPPPSMPRARVACCPISSGPLSGQEVVKSDGENCRVVDYVDYIADVDAPVDYSLENIPTRCADYFVPGGDTLFKYDSDAYIYMSLRDSSSDEDEKKAEEKFVRRVKRRTLRRRIRMERRRRGRDIEWSVDEMVHWLVTPEGDPDSCSSEDSLIDLLRTRARLNPKQLMSPMSIDETLAEIHLRPRTSRESP